MNNWGEISAFTQAGNYAVYKFKNTSSSFTFKLCDSNWGNAWKSDDTTYSNAKTNAYYYIYYNAATKAEPTYRWVMI